MLTAFELLKDFIESCVFIHDDWRSITGKLDWDQYDLNPFLLDVDICVVNSLAGFGNEYIEFLQTLKVFPKKLISPEQHGYYLTKNLLGDPNALSNLKEIVKRKRLNISTFYTEDQEVLDSLVSALSSTEHIPQIYPPKSAFLFANRKDRVRQRIERAGIPLPEGAVCHSLDDILYFHDKSNRQHLGIIIKQSHRSLFLVRTKKDIVDLEPRLVFPLIVEAKYTSRSSPICHFIVWKGQVEHLFTVNQIIKDGHHVGNSAPLGLPLEVAQRIISYTRKVAGQIPDFIGVFGVDYIVTDDDNVLMVDVNPRFCSSTYPFYFLRKVGFPSECVQVKYRIVESRVKNLSVLFKDHEFVPLDPDQGVGMLLFNPVFDFSRELVYKFSYLVIARTQDRLEALEQTIENMVKRVEVHI